MREESSVVAKKLNNYFETQNDSSSQSKAEPKSNIVKNALATSLMGLAVLMTKATLYLVRFIKKLEA